MQRAATVCPLRFRPSASNPQGGCRCSLIIYIMVVKALPGLNTASQSTTSMHSSSHSSTMLEGDADTKRVSKRVSTLRQSVCTERKGAHRPML